jgi:hypothetical protein
VFSIKKVEPAVKTFYNRFRKVFEKVFSFYDKNVVQMSGCRLGKKKNRRKKKKQTKKEMKDRKKERQKEKQKERERKRERQ